MSWKTQLVETIEKQITLIKNNNLTIKERLESIGDVLSKIYDCQIIETEMVKSVFEVLEKLVVVLSRGTLIVSKKKMDKIKKKFKLFHLSKLEKDSNRE